MLTTRSYNSPALNCNRGRRVSVCAQSAGGKDVKKVVLAYSGGLDTSVILTWLKDTYDCEVVTFTADLGQVCISMVGGIFVIEEGYWSLVHT